MDHAEHLSLIVINDGNGSQCGANYQYRLSIYKSFRSPKNLARMTVDWVSAANRWVFTTGGEEAGLVEVLAAAALVAKHYLDLTKEGA